MRSKLFYPVLGLVLLSLVSYTQSTKRRIYLNTQYKSFSPTFPGYKASGFAILGDTIEWYNQAPSSETIVGIDLHTITSVEGKIPVGSSPFNYIIDGYNYGTSVTYIPTQLGVYEYECSFHNPPGEIYGMKQKFYVFPTGTILCPGSSIDGDTCYLNRCLTCIGYFLNCNCVTPDVYKTSKCSNGLYNNKTCTGIGNCSTCTGYVQNCICTQAGVTFSGCGIGLKEGNTCTGVADCANCVGTVVGCACTTTGISSVNQSFVSANAPLIYPNPARTEINIPLNVAIKFKIFIYNQQGEEVMTHSPSFVSNYLMDISTLPAGMYYVQTKYCACSTPKEACQGANKQYRFIKE